MKHILFVLLLLFVSCGENSSNENKQESPNMTRYELIYRVYWTSTHSNVYTVYGKEPFYVGSSKGTNYISKGGMAGPTVISTSAPIEILSHKKINQ